MSAPAWGVSSYPEGDPGNVLEPQPHVYVRKNVQKRPKKADEKQLDKWLNAKNNNKLTC